MDAAEARGSKALAIVFSGGLLLAAIYLGRAVEALLVFQETVPALLVATAVMLASYACGVLSIGAARRVFAGADEVTRASVPEAALIGAAVFGTIVGAIACLSVVPLPAVTIALAAAGCVLLWRTRSAIAPARGTIAAIAIAPAVVLAFVQAITPVVSADELIYKLAVPHAYELYGRMIELPLNSNSYLAMAIHLADLPALMLGGAIAAKLVHFFIYLAALASVHRLAVRFLPGAEWWSVAVVAYTPALLFTSGWAFTEWAVLGLLLTSFERYQRFLDTNERAHLVIAAAAAGAAAAVKYTALPWLLPCALLILWRHRSDRRVMIVTTCVIAFFGSFFYVRNLAWSGSPVAPMLLENAPKVNNYRSGYAFSGWVDLVRGKDVIDPEISDEALGILLPLCVLAALAAVRRKDRATSDLLIIGGTQAAILLTIAPGTRNMINGAVALALPGAAMIALWWRTSPVWAQHVTIAAAIAAAAVQSVQPTSTLSQVIPYLSGAESEGEYFARTRSFVPAYTWLARTPPSTRVLFIGETRTLNMQRQFVSGGNLDGPRVSTWLGTFRTPEAMAAGLRRDGISHVLFHPGWYRVTADGKPPFDMLQSEFGVAVTPATHAVLNGFFQAHTTLRYRDGEYLIFEVKQ